MKVFCLFFCMFISVSVFSQTNENEEKILEDFISQVINTTDLNACVYDYLKVDKSYFYDGKLKPFFLDCLSSYIKEIKDEIQNNEGNYKILCHTSNGDNNIILDFKLKVNDYSGVYYLVLNDKVITNLIVKDSKIVSLCTSLFDVQGHRKPWLLNKAS